MGRTRRTLRHTVFLLFGGVVGAGVVYFWFGIKHLSCVCKQHLAWSPL